MKTPKGSVIFEPLPVTILIPATFGPGMLAKKLIYASSDSLPDSLSPPVVSESAEPVVSPRSELSDSALSAAAVLVPAAAAAALAASP